LQPNESLYEQKPEEPKPVVPASTTSAPKSTPSLHSRFEYFDDESSTNARTGGTNVSGHVAAPKSSDFCQEYGMGNGFQKKSSSTASKTQVIQYAKILLRCLKLQCLLLTSGNSASVQT
jgi:ADP-ribosylation factor GTPase-activating protein 2/3